MSATSRGYGTEHRKKRAYYRAVVEAGQATCVRCMIPITPPGEACPKCGREVAKGRPTPGYCGLDVGHDDVDRSIYAGTEHMCCNRRAGGSKGGKTTARKFRVQVWSRQWLSD